MNILIVIPNSNFAPTIPLGPLSIATYLNAHGHRAEICDCLLKKDSIEKAFSTSAQFRPDIVALSVMSSAGLAHARKIAALCRSKGIKTVWGGGQITAYYDVILNSGEADFVSMGDGELSLTQLADALEEKNGVTLSDVSGLAYMRGNEIITNPVNTLPQEELPQLDLTLVDVKSYQQPFFCTKKMVHLYLSKGCPFNCAFCNRKVIGDTVYRVRKTEYVINEIRYLVNECGCDGIYFYDELWCINKKAAAEFCERLSRENLRFYFGCFARIGQYDENDLKMLYDAGCRWMLFGIESGSEEMRLKLNKKIDTDEIIKTFEICHKLGIITQASFIVGLPGETEEQLRQTVDLAFTIHADLLPFSNFTPIKGAVLYDELKAQGKITEVTDINRLEKEIMPTERIKSNFTRVPTAELNVVRAFFRWCGFSGADNNLSKFEIAKEIAVRYTKIIFSGKSLNFSGISESFTVLADVVFNVFLHPGIRKKYGLYKKNFKYREEK